MGYELEDCFEMNKKYPDTFEIPSHYYLRNLKAGQHVKLIFIEEGKSPERMWVQLTFIHYPYFQGRLDNEPFELETIKAHDEVKFTANNIASIL